jgi:hypothetical protein
MIAPKPFRVCEYIVVLEPYIFPPHSTHAAQYRQRTLTVIQQHVLHSGVGRSNRRDVRVYLEHILQSTIPIIADACPPPEMQHHHHAQTTRELTFHNPIPLLLISGRKRTDHADKTRMHVSLSSTRFLLCFDRITPLGFAFSWLHEDPCFL